MFRKFIRAIILIPLAIVLVGWAVANRGPVAISFDPFNRTDPAYVLTVPIFVMGFALLIAGVVFGGAAAWFRQGKWRRAHARLAAEIRTVRAELDRHKRLAAARDGRALARPDDPIARRPPAA
jgi:hypothetical protein